MSPEFYEQAKRIIEQSQELPEASRAEYIQNICAGKPDLLDYVRRQLSASAKARSEMPTRRTSSTYGEIPVRLGSFDIEALIGQGGMGKVFRAWDPHLERTVAIKTIRIGGNFDVATNRKILLAEMKFGGKLTGINGIVTFLYADVDEESGVAYIVMEFVDGPSLQSLIQPGRPLEQSLALHILRQAAAALDQAHARGVVHCDVKPSNLLLDKDNKVKITDFGISRFREPGVDPETSFAQGLGTPEYVSPEQSSGNKLLDGRSDQYSLAVVAFQMLTGHLPFDGSRLQPASAVNSVLPVFVDEPLKRAMAREAVRRFDNCAQFVEALSVALRRKPVANAAAEDMPDAFATVPTHPANLRRVPVAPEPARPKSRMPIVYAAIAAALVAALSSAAVLRYTNLFPWAKRLAAGVPSVEKPASKPGVIDPGGSGSSATSPGRDTSAPAVIGKLPRQADKPAPGNTTSGDGNPSGPIAKQPIPLPLIAHFAVEPATIGPGERARLSWEISGADIAAIDQGVGKVEPATTGSVEIMPVATTEYTLSATNSTGETPARVTVVVRPPSILAMPPGAVETLLRTGRKQLERHEYPAARDSLLKAAQGGNSESMVLLGAMYSEGLGGLRDGPEAVRWFQQAAAADNVRGMYNLGHMYANGWEGHKRNDVEAASWYGKAEQRGSTDAAYRLGLMFEQGKGVPMDLNEARDLYQKAGTPEARSRLAMLPKAPAKTGPPEQRAEPLLTLHSISPNPIQENKVRQYTLSGSGFSLGSEVRIDVNGFVGSRPDRANYRPVEVGPGGSWLKVYINVLSRQGQQAIHVSVHNPDGQEVRLEARTQR